MGVRLTADEELAPQLREDSSVGAEAGDRAWPEVLLRPGAGSSPRPVGLGPPQGEGELSLTGRGGARPGGGANPGGGSMQGPGHAPG